MRWALPVAIVASAALLSLATVYTTMNDHRSRWCVAMAARVAFPDLKAAGALSKPRTILECSDEEYGFGVSLEECRRSLGGLR